MIKNILPAFFAVTLLIIASCAHTPKAPAHSQPSMEASLEMLVDTIIDGLAETQTTKIAVIEFSDIQGDVNNLGRFIAEELTTRLYQSGRFEVVERQLLAKVIAEQKLGISGYIDDDTAISLGKILGVDAIASGSLTDLGTSIKVNARLISTESGKVFAAGSVKLTKDATICTLLGEKPLHPSKTAKKHKTDKARWMQFTFELTEAQQEGQTVTCRFWVTNTSKQDADLRILGTGRGSGKYIETHVYDAAGNQLKNVLLRFGDEGFRQLNIYPGLIDKSIPAGITIPMELQVQGIAEETTQLPLIQFILGEYPGSKLMFKKVPVTI